MAGTGHELHGFLNVLKPPPLTSNDVVAIVRRLTNSPRVGHAGTLDPEAVGVLPVALGRATHGISNEAFHRKLYWTDGIFGTSTSTDDAEGEVLERGSTASLSLGALVTALGKFVGSYPQAPPAISAVHVSGERSYLRARRDGDYSTPGPRAVCVDAIDVVGWTEPRLSMLVSCRSGTYIRSLVRDLGRAIGCPAHVAGLVRLRVGPFDIRNAVDLDTLQAIASANRWPEVLIPEDTLESANPILVVDEDQRNHYAVGRNWPGLPPICAVPNATVFADDGAWLGFAELAAGRWQPKRVPRPVALGHTS